MAHGHLVYELDMFTKRFLAGTEQFSCRAQISSHARRDSSVGCASATYADGRRFEPHVRQHPLGLVSDCSWRVIVVLTCHQIIIQIQISWRLVM